MRYPKVCLNHNWRLNLLDEDFVQNPYPYFQFLRDCQPVHRMANGTWVITRYTDIQDLLLGKTSPTHALGNEPSLYSLLNERNLDKYACADVANNMIAFKDAEAHKTLRRQVMFAFNKPLKNTELTFPFLILKLEHLQKKGSFKAIQELGSPIAVIVALEILGINIDNRGDIASLTNDLLYILSQIPSHEDRARIDESAQLLRNLIKQSLKIAHTTDNQIINSFADLITQGRISKIEAIDNLILLLVDSVQNVDNLIAMMLIWYRKYPDATKDILVNRDLVPFFVEECLRFESPVQFVGRVVKSSFEIYGQQLKPNQSVLLMLASANRDPDVFESPNTFNIYRQGAQQLTFGRGAHTCLGNQLVRQIACLVFNAILDSIPTYQINDKTLSTYPIWQSRIGHRWVEDYFIET